LNLNGIAFQEGRLLVLDGCGQFGQGRPYRGIVRR